VLAACVTNIVLDLLFVPVFGWGAFGAALATVISQGMSMFLCIGFMVRNKFHFNFKRASFKIDKEQLKLIFKIGLPTSISNSITSFSFMFVTVIVNVVGGVYASAAVGAAGKFNSFAFMPVFAISASISTMCAQNIGANRLDRAVKATRYGTAVSFVIMLAFFFLLMLFPAPIIRLFGDDPRMIEYGVEYYRSFAFDLLFVPFIFCLNGLFIGGGHTLFNLVTNAMSAVLLRVPICYLFGVVFEWGILGVGMGAPAASAGTLIVMIIFLLTGRWKTNVAMKHNSME
jgi:putative MATE family efflux protein